jgi:hypothetical protein
LLLGEIKWTGGRNDDALQDPDLFIISPAALSSAPLGLAARI